MDQELKTILEALLDSEDATGCSDDLTVVAMSSVRKLRQYLLRPAPDKMTSRRHHWHIEVSIDGLIHLTLTQHTAALVASALEIVSPDRDKDLRNARALALALESHCED